jgi:hypothetical protein
VETVQNVSMMHVVGGPLNLAVLSLSVAEFCFPLHSKSDNVSTKSYLAEEHVRISNDVHHCSLTEVFHLKRTKHCIIYLFL